jgi:hypothetical protein
MKKLNVVHANFGKPFVSTIELFAGFEYKTHKKLKQVIFNNRAEFEERGELIVASVEGTIISLKTFASRYQNVTNKKRF